LHGPSVVHVDERELQRWKLMRASPGRRHYSVSTTDSLEQPQVDLADRIAVIVGLALLTVFLLFSRSNSIEPKGPGATQAACCSMPQEPGAHPTAAEIHDDFSQSWPYFARTETTMKAFLSPCHKPIDTCGTHGIGQ